MVIESRSMEKDGQNDFLVALSGRVASLYLRY